MTDNKNVFIVDPVSDVDTFVKVNNLPRVTNPSLFESEGVPTSDGLLSNELFGTDSKSRSSIFGYIELNGTFLHPLIYKIWSRMDSTISKIVWTDNKYKVNSKGEIVEDENGESGIDFLKNNIDLIKIKHTDSSKRDTNIEFLRKNKKKMFITKMIVSPPYIRDVLISNGKTEVGELNQMYQKILINANALASLAEYGIENSYITRGNIQETIVKVYNFFTKAPNLGQKKGIIRRAVLSKTTDYASRLVLSAPNLNVESPSELVTTMDYASIPLPSLCGNVKPFLIFWIRNYFNNLYSGTGILFDEKENETFNRITVEDFEMQFNDEVYEKEINYFIESYSNRFKPISYVYNKKTYYFYITLGEERRPITWCELFYIAISEIVQDKHCLITRHPVDSYYSQFPCKITINSTLDTEKVTIKNTTYNTYPKIRAKDINTNTSNKFKDTLNIFNPYLGAILGDYDGDQVGIKVVFSDEANYELSQHLKSSLNYIDLGCNGVRKSSNEAIQAMYNLTMVLPEDINKLGEPKF